MPRKQNAKTKLLRRAAAQNLMGRLGGPVYEAKRRYKMYSRLKEKYEHATNMVVQSVFALYLAADKDVRKLELIAERLKVQTAEGDDAITLADRIARQGLGLKWSGNSPMVVRYVASLTDDPNEFVLTMRAEGGFQRCLQKARKQSHDGDEFEFDDAWAGLERKGSVQKLELEAGQHIVLVDVTKSGKLKARGSIPAEDYSEIETLVEEVTELQPKQWTLVKPNS